MARPGWVPVAVGCTADRAVLRTAVTHDAVASDIQAADVAQRRDAQHVVNTEQTPKEPKHWSHGSPRKRKLE